MEDANSITSLIDESANISGEKTFVSLSPSASYAFDKHNIIYKSMLDYGGGDERYSQGIENFQRIDRFVTILDEELAHCHNIPILTPARYSIYNLKFLFDVLSTKIHTLKTIIDTENADFVRLYTSFPTRWDFRRDVFSEDESVYAEVLKMTGWYIPVEIIQSYHRNLQKSTIVEKKNKRYFPFFIGVKKILFFILIFGGKICRRIIAGKELYYTLTRRSRKPVLLLGGYDWEDAVDELYRAGFYPIYRITDKTRERDLSSTCNYGEEVQKVCTLHHSMREFDTILGIDVSAFFFERVSDIIGDSIRKSIVSYYTIREMIQQKKIQALLCSTRPFATTRAAIEAAKDEGIPVVSWQHGGAGYCYNPIMPFAEFIDSDWHFVFGQGVAESYQKTSERIGLKKIPIFVPVGSSSLDKFRSLAKESPVPKVNRPIVYITTHYIHNINIVSQNLDPYLWNEHLWLIQKQFMDLAKKYPEKKFIIKLHPIHENKEPLISYAKDKRIKNLKIITLEMSVRELTDIADVVVFDLISTGILQVLTSNLPVFVYSGLHEIDEEVVFHLKKRAYACKRYETFFSILNEYINTRKVADFSIDTANSDFLIRYGTDIKNYGSAERAAKKLNEIVLGKEENFLV